MQILIAPDSFKGSVSALKAGQALAEGVGDTLPAAQCQILPLADGGEGTVAAFQAILGGDSVSVVVEGPLGAPVEAVFSHSPARRLAVVEMAAASGLPLVGAGGLDPAAASTHGTGGLDPAAASTHGTGALIRAALDRGVSQILLGLGGSATVDGGAGALQALGAVFRDGAGKPVRACGGTLAQIAQVDLSGLDPRLASVALTLACDVTTPLLGPQGAVAVFGPQKGIRPEQSPSFEAALAHFAAVLATACGRNPAAQPGSGAAGGLAFGLKAAVPQAEVRSGFALIADYATLTERLATCDLVLTGEGRLDAQSSLGKAPLALARLAHAQGVPVIAFAGDITASPADLAAAGVSLAVPIVDRPMPLAQAMAEAPALLRRAAARTLQALTLGAHCLPPAPLGE